MLKEIFINSVSLAIVALYVLVAKLIMDLWVATPATYNLPEYYKWIQFASGVIMFSIVSNWTRDMLATKVEL